MFLWNIAVTSLAEVWIEIQRTMLQIKDSVSHFPRGSVDWNFCFGCEAKGNARHFPRGSVDWNMQKQQQATQWVCHFPRGSVDWNLYRYSLLCHDWVTSLAEVWIEISIRTRICRNGSVTSLAEVWIEILVINWYEMMCISHFPRGSVDWNDCS